MAPNSLPVAEMRRTADHQAAEQAAIASAAIREVIELIASEHGRLGDAIRALHDWSTSLISGDILATDPEFSLTAIRAMCNVEEIASSSTKQLVSLAGHSLRIPQRDIAEAAHTTQPTIQRWLAKSAESGK